ncbi:hypothetical protein Trco_006760 [Trichoderma cornu-damae]|uniref:Uncharacterized protein n=1 Tax=Trichoderma cornu-damae TaxID=654480 RepID=A0A9P8QLV7_9HYPO|nr:hypothetical protein Trco_006760 [Trichoderma cornu-damae]
MTAYKPTVEAPKESFIVFARTDCEAKIVPRIKFGPMRVEVGPCGVYSSLKGVILAIELKRWDGVIENVLVSEEPREVTPTALLRHFGKRLDDLAHKDVFLAPFVQLDSLNL